MWKSEKLTPQPEAIPIEDQSSLNRRSEMVGESYKKIETGILDAGTALCRRILLTVSIGWCSFSTLGVHHQLTY